MTTTKYIQIQISGDADAVDASIALLHALNFINGGIWSQAIRKRNPIVRVAARSFDVSYTKSISHCNTSRSP